MTTSPVPSITDELLGELDRAEKSHLDGEVRDMARGALLHIRSLTERLEKAEKDAARYQWLLTETWFQEAFDRFSPDDGGLLSRFIECAAEIIDRQITNDPLPAAPAIAQEGQSHE